MVALPLELRQEPDIAALARPLVPGVDLLLVVLHAVSVLYRRLYGAQLRHSGTLVQLAQACDRPGWHRVQGPISQVGHSVIETFESE